MENERKRRSARTFLLGSLVGASAAIAAVDRRRRLERRRRRPRGLAAFESAPCYREYLDRAGERGSEIQRGG